MDLNFLNNKEPEKGRKKLPKPTKFSGNILGAIIFFMLITALYLVVSGDGKSTPEIPISELAQNVTAGEVKNILVEGDKLTITYNNDEIKTTKKDIINILLSQNVKSSIENSLKSGDIKIEITAERLELVSKGYLNIYNKIND